MLHPAPPVMDHRRRREDVCLCDTAVLLTEHESILRRYVVDDEGCETRKLATWWRNERIVLCVGLGPLRRFLLRWVRIHRAQKCRFELALARVRRRELLSRDELVKDCTVQQSKVMSCCVDGLERLHRQWLVRLQFVDACACSVALLSMREQWLRWCIQQQLERQLIEAQESAARRSAQCRFVETCQEARLHFLATSLYSQETEVRSLLAYDEACMWNARGGMVRRSLQYYWLREIEFEECVQRALVVRRLANNLEVDLLAIQREFLNQFQARIASAWRCFAAKRTAKEMRKAIEDQQNLEMQQEATLFGKRFIVGQEEKTARAGCVHDEGVEVSRLFCHFAEESLEMQRNPFAAFVSNASQHAANALRLLEGETKRKRDMYATAVVLHFTDEHARFLAAVSAETLKQNESLFDTHFSATRSIFEVAASEACERRDIAHEMERSYLVIGSLLALTLTSTMLLETAAACASDRKVSGLFKKKKVCTN